MKNENTITNGEPEYTGHLLLFRGKDWDERLGPEELQEVMARVMAWFEGLNASGKVKGGQPLARGGVNISGRGGTSVSDGPFAESKEAIAGYLLLATGDFDEAVAIARSCPTLDHGIEIEVRPVLDECPVFKRVGKRISGIAA